MANGSKPVPDLEPEVIAETHGVSRQTVVRWITDGVGGVRLKATKVGNQWRTTEADLNEFFRLTTEAALSK